MEWLEAEGESVDDAVQAAIDELGLESVDQVDVEVLREPKKGFLGLGGQMALVKVTRKPSKRRRKRRRGSGTSSRSESRSSDDNKQPSSSRSSGSNRGSGSSRSQKSSDGNGSGRSSGSKSGSRSSSDNRSKSSNSGSSRSKGGSQSGKSRPTSKQGSKKKRPSQEAAVTDNKGQDKEQASIEEQGEVAVDFLKGLVDSFGLEGEVSSRIDDEVLYLDVTGDTEALVGNRGTIMQSVLELSRTVVQRKTFGAPRMRIDIAGYGARRREALTIYAGRLAEKVKEDGGEAMLEPMNPADRKVVHDAIGEIDGVRSYSEGEDPHRSVVVAAE
ncbi:MAG: hypothetical protein HKN91_11705 [Acidimicrobiia bacterium]|nr:hypothetical protein [Acidimicrobiia bacterium]